jgi:hypothetical protein
MQELHDFINDGFGWKCRQCDKDLHAPSPGEQGLPRYFREGESESKMPDLSNSALAKWTDKTRRYLTCPRCGITEAAEVN